LDPASFFYILTFLVLLLLSAFFSGSETAYFSLTSSTLKNLKKSKKHKERQVAILSEESKRLLIAIIIGNTLVNVAIASLAAILMTRMAKSYGFNEILVLVINVALVTLVILFFSEIIPKVTAARNSRKMAIKFVYPLTFFYYLFYPVSIVLEFMTRLISELLGIEKNKHQLTEEELRTLVDIGEERGALRKDEKEMIHSIFEMSETTVKEIMVPRTDMVCIEKEASLSHVLQIIKEKGHSRIPVYADTLDNIVGILYVKDLLPLLKRRNVNDIDFAKLSRPPYYVPEQKRINQLLREYQTEKIHLAIVVDEYGGTSGLVTLEDVIEEIVGEIQDEYDFEMPPYQKINDNTFIVDGGMALEEINEELGLDLPTEEGVETLAGFLLGQFGMVPKSKEKLNWNGYEFTIEKSSKNRIHQVRIFYKKHGQ
jgi:putative hemolysin